MLTVKDVMTKKVVAAYPTMKVINAAKILWQKNFSGLPVINKKRQVIGVVTDYDLISPDHQIHIPSYIKVLKSLKYFSRKQDLHQRLVEKLSDLTVADVMTKDAYCVSANTPLSQVAKILTHKNFGFLPVVKDRGVLVGVVARSDLVKIMME